jgi:hypothetical protein
MVAASSGAFLRWFLSYLKAYKCSSAHRKVINGDLMAIFYYVSSESRAGISSELWHKYGTVILNFDIFLNFVPNAEPALRLGGEVNI